jgi:hypothetical protein
MQRTLAALGCLIVSACYLKLLKFKFQMFVYEKQRLYSTAQISVARGYDLINFRLYEIGHETLLLKTPLLKPPEDDARFSLLGAGRVITLECNGTIKKDNSR